MKFLQLNKILKWILAKMASMILKKYKPAIIGITGSAGKTSAKEAVYSVVKSGYSTRRSLGNFNNELGMPLTILGDYDEIRGIFFWPKAICKAVWKLIFKDKNYPEVLILEMAADKPGDIKHLVGIARPHVGIITAIGEIPVHVEFYSGPEAVAKEKGRLIEALPNDGYAILNFDDQIVYNLRNRTRAKVLTYGFDENADIQISNLENRQNNGLPEGISFKIRYGGSFVPIRLNAAFGRPQAYAAAAAVAVGLSFGMNLVKISEALLNYESSSGRMKLLKGVKNSLILDDSYNASPLSMRAALETISNLPAKRRVGVLADMLEIGRYSTEAHQSIGELAAKKLDYLFCVGPRARFISDSALKSGFDPKKIQVFDTSDTAKKMIEREIRPGDLILIKGSHSMKLEKVIEEIKMKDTGPDWLAK